MLLYDVQSQFGKRMLCVGDDPILLKSRTLILRKEGYVMRACEGREAVPLIYRERFDVVLICRSISPAQALTLARVIHSHSDTKVIRLAPRMGAEDWPFDFAIDTMAGPVNFLNTLAEVVAPGASRNALHDPR